MANEQWRQTSHSRLLEPHHQQAVRTDLSKAASDALLRYCAFNKPISTTLSQK